ncbi:hypothetical protein [Streptosporangium sp. NPDC020145]|uniref:hypothetical protein n=1 Tax=Streptosporangium sp. NPDC020145 TaxID=3154694 RepID=UPI003434F8ED
MNGYFERLTAAMTEAGMPADRVEATVTDLRAYLAESGGDPEEEFGPADELAAELTGASAPPVEGAQTWRWTADLFHDVKMLNEYGAQGWEVEKVDVKGMFVSVRDPENSQQWEYRRETRRPGLVESLAPDGWEPCGTWVWFEYFKRPRAVSLGPAAELSAPPRGPGRGFFLSPRFYALVGVLLVAEVVFTVLVLVVGKDEIGEFDGLDTLFGLFTGATLGVAAVVAVLWLFSRSRGGGRDERDGDGGSRRAP